MKTILNQLYRPYFKSIGLFPSEGSSHCKRCGLNYELNPSVGTGYYWLYPIDNWYAVAIYSFVFKTDFQVRHAHRPCLMLGNFTFSSTEQLCRRNISPTKAITGFAADDHDVFQMEIKKGTGVHSVVVAFTPEFDREFMPKKFSGVSQNLAQILAGLDGSEINPEITEVFRRICVFQPSREIAKTYYESKIMEILCLLVQWDRNQLRPVHDNGIADSDRSRLHDVAGYLDKHYQSSISLQSLAKIACMSHNKLTGLFKKVYGSTITEYVQSLRVEKSKEMLLNSNHNIGTIANDVGYKLHSSFSEVFKHTTGFTPNEFRKNTLQS